MLPANESSTSGSECAGLGSALDDMSFGSLRSSRGVPNALQCRHVQLHASIRHERTERPGRADNTGGQRVRQNIHCCYETGLMTLFRSVLIKLFVFTVCLGMVPVVSYFASLRYFWNGIAIYAVHSGSHTHPRKLDVCSNHLRGSSKHSPCSVHSFLHYGRPAKQNNYTTNPTGNKKGEIIH